tara:strand:- start:82 stop:507 length:426 start_codon:yes stop_codon:yes gene_type:complete
MRLILAFILSALAPALVVTVPYLADQLLRYEFNEFIAIRTSKVLVVSLIYAALHVVVIGIPGYIGLKAIGKLNRITVYVGGFIAGATPITVFSLIEARAASGEDGVIEALIFFGVLGFIGGVAFWMAKPNKKQQADLRRLC